MLSNGWFSGPVALLPSSSTTPTLLTLSVRMAPFSRHHTAGTAFAVNSLWIEIYGVGKGRRASDRQGDREEEMGGGKGEEGREVDDREQDRDANIC